MQPHKIIALSVLFIAAGVMLAPAAGTPATTPGTGSVTAGTHPATTGKGPDLDLDVTLSTIHMKLPTNWNLNVGGKILLEASPEQPDKDATGTFQASLSVSLGTLAGGTGKADVALGTGQQANAARQETGYQAIEKPAAISIGGLAGVKFGGTFKRGGLELRNATWLLARGNQIYMFTFTSLNSKWALYQSLIIKSVATFIPRNDPVPATRKAATLPAPKRP